jgi:hypothetical protein
VGYSLAVISVFLAFVYTLQTSDEGAWQLFVGFLTMVIFFCLKITFSPGVLALILGFCTFTLVQHDEFRFFEVWSAFTSIVTWRFSEKIRAGYTALSFVWVIFAFLFPGSSGADALETGINGASDASGAIDTVMT